MTYTEQAFKYRAATFYIFLACFIAAIAGVAYFRNFYYYFTVVILSYNLVKFLFMCFIMIVALMKYNSSIDSYKNRKNGNIVCSKKVNHVVIIPNYNESLKVLRNTLTFLADQSRAINYCILLAMQKHEENSEEKARLLVQ